MRPTLLQVFKATDRMLRAKSPAWAKRWAALARALNAQRVAS